MTRTARRLVWIGLGVSALVIVGYAKMAAVADSPTVKQMAQALGENKLVALCLQGGATKDNESSRRAAQALVADELLRGQAVMIVGDPAKDRKLARTCGLRRPLTRSTIVLVMPPDKQLAVIVGATTKEVLKAKLQAALAASSATCGSGCAPGSCGQ